MNIMFIVTLFILFFAILQGWRKGILGIVFGLVSWIFILIFIWFSHAYIEDYIMTNTNIYQEMCKVTEKELEKKEETSNPNAGIEEWWKNITKDLPKITSEKMQIDLGLDFSSLANSDSTLLEEKKIEVKEQLSEEIARFIVRGISVLIALVIANIIVWIVGSMVKSVGRVPVIREVNSLLGIAAGAVEGFLIIWILMYIGVCISNTTIGQGMIQDIYESQFLTYLYQHNLIMAFVATI